VTPQRPPRQENSGTALALLGILLVVALLFLLVALVLPQILGLLLVVFGFFFLGVVHYLIWGWWFRVSPDQKNETDVD